MADGTSWNRAVISSLELRTYRGRLIYALLAAVLVLLSIAVIVPFLYAFTSGLKTGREIFSPNFNLLPAEANWGNYTQAWNYFQLPRLFLNTTILVIGGLISQIGVSMLAAYSLSRLKPIGGRYIMLAFLVTLMIL